MFEKKIDSNFLFLLLLFASFFPSIVYVWPFFYPFSDERTLKGKVMWKIEIPFFLLKSLTPTFTSCSWQKLAWLLKNHVGKSKVEELKKKAKVGKIENEIKGEKFWQSVKNVCMTMAIIEDGKKDEKREKNSIKIIQFIEKHRGASTSVSWRDW